MSDQGDRMKRWRWIPVPVVATVLLAVGYVGAPGETPPAAAADVGGFRATPAVSDLVELNRLIGVFEERTMDHSDSLDYRYLGALHLDRGRLTSDLASYDRASSAFESAIALYPGDLASQTGLARTALALHDFTTALDIAGEVYAADPSRMAALAVIGDAQLELGLYETAATSSRILRSELGSDPAVLVRASRLAFITGTAATAQQLADQAVAEAESIGLSRRDVGWYRTFAAGVAFDSGDLVVAERLLSAALDDDPSAPASLAGWGRVLLARGETAPAIEAFERATERFPSPQYLAELGDAYLLAGEAGKAADVFATVEVIGHLAAASGAAYNRSLVMFYADHDRAPERAIEMAKAELAERHDVYGYDAYGWALYRAGRLHEARAALATALSLGTPQPEFHYHSGLIALALGDDATAVDELEQALALNPYFDPIQAPDARRILAGVSR